MKRFICCFLAFGFSLTVFSQRSFFVYIQTEGEQPFFVRMGDKTHSSTASGYLILSRLKDSVYSFKAGFPQQKWPEQQFTIQVKGNDLGYLLKNFGEKGWGLFDLQSMNIQMAEKESTVARPAPELRQVSAFTAVLSKAANDPSLLEKPVPLKQEQKPVAPQQAVVKEQVPVKKEDTSTALAVNSPEKKETTAATASQPSQTNTTRDTTVAELATATPVQPKAEQIPDSSKMANAPVLTDSVKTGLSSNSKLADEQKPVIKEEPVQKPVEKPVEEAKSEPVTQAPAVVEPVADFSRSKVVKRSETSNSDGLGILYIDEYQDGNRDTVRILIPHVKSNPFAVNEAPKEEKKLLDIPVSVKEPAQAPKKQEQVAGCKAATEAEIAKLRKKMAAEVADDVMIGEARKLFQSKCLTVKQVKGLASVFQNDAARFQFFEAAYKHVSDIENFASLEQELKNGYYVNRFKAIMK